MKKIRLFVFAALAIALLSIPMVAQASSKPDQEVERVGLVVAYTPNESITIADRDGVQTTFAIAADVKILPKHRAAELVVGSYVTIISPNSADGVATGIVIHPQVPNGFTNATEPPLPSATSTSEPVETATESPTSTETPAVTETETETATATATNTGEVPTDTATATSTATGTAAANPQAAAQSFIEWLTLLFSQLTGSNNG
jgi:hypothetical protein